MMYHLAFIKTVCFNKLWLLLSPVCATIAVTEVFLGQLMIAVVVAVIGAMPPTIAIILMAKKQSAERVAGNRELLEGQKEVVKAVDGQLAKFVEAKQQVGHAAGVAQERQEQRGRDDAVKGEGPTKVEVINKKDNPVPTTIDKIAKVS